MTSLYRIEFNKAYLKDLEKIPLRARKQIRESVSDLAYNPRPDGCKKLQGNKNPPLYRIRSGITCFYNLLFCSYASTIGCHLD